MLIFVYAERRDFIVILSIIMLCDILLDVIMLIGVMLNVIIPSDIIQSGVTLMVIIMSV